MNKEELLKKLILLNIHPKYFSIGIEIKNDAYNIERLYNGKYYVYFLERGEKNDLKIFETEEEALVELINCLESNLKNGFDLTK